MSRSARRARCAVLAAVLGAAATVAASAPPVSYDASRAAKPAGLASGTPAPGSKASPSWSTLTPPREAREEAPYFLGTPVDGPLVGTTIGRPIGGTAQTDAQPSGHALRPVPRGRNPRPCDPSPQCLSGHQPRHLR